MFQPYLGWLLHIIPNDSYFQASKHQTVDVQVQNCSWRLFPKELMKLRILRWSSQNSPVFKASSAPLQTCGALHQSFFSPPEQCEDMPFLRLGSSWSSHSVPFFFIPDDVLAIDYRGLLRLAPPIRIVYTWPDSKCLVQFFNTKPLWYPLR